MCRHRLRDAFRAQFARFPGQISRAVKVPRHLVNLDFEECSVSHFQQIVAQAIHFLMQQRSKGPGVIRGIHRFNVPPMPNDWQDSFASRFSSATPITQGKISDPTLSDRIIHRIRIPAIASHAKARKVTNATSHQNFFFAGHAAQPDLGPSPNSRATNSS